MARDFYLRLHLFGLLCEDGYRRDLSFFWVANGVPAYRKNYVRRATQHAESMLEAGEIETYELEETRDERPKRKLARRNPKAPTAKTRVPLGGLR